MFSFFISVCLRAVSSSCSLVCAAVICYCTISPSTYQLEDNKQQQRRICSQIRHAYVTKVTCAFLYSYVLYRWSSGTFTYPLCSYLYSAWYELVPTWKYQLVLTWSSSSGLNFPRAIRAHITAKLHELKRVLDAGRGGWRANHGASTDVARVEISSALVLCERQTPMHPRTHQYTQGK